MAEEEGEKISRANNENRTEKDGKGGREGGEKERLSSIKWTDGRLS